MNHRSKRIATIALLTGLVAACTTAPQAAQAQSTDSAGLPGQDADANAWFDYFMKRHKRGDLDGWIPRDRNRDFAQISFSGDCKLADPCIVSHRDDGSWLATCKPGFDGSKPSFIGEPARLGRLNLKSEQGDVQCERLLPVRNGWAGTCEKTVKPDPESDATEIQSCSVKVNTKAQTVAYSAKLPNEITGLSFCGVQYGDCKVAQKDVDLTIACGEGDAQKLIRATMVGNTFQHWHRKGESWFQCKGKWDGQAVRGACTQWLGFGNEGVPEVCDDLAFDAEDPLAHGSCEQILPEEGFTLEGCGMQGACFAVQRGCDWRITCGEQSYSGRINRRRRMTFKNSEGQDCIASVGLDGKLRGSCRNSISSWLENIGQPFPAFQSCSFKSVAPQSQQGCFQMPSTISTRGCGAFFNNCRVYQDGCEFITQCESGQHSFYGVVNSDSIRFSGLAGYECNAELVDQDGKQRLLGECTRQEADGSVSKCLDLTDAFGAPLALDWEQ